METIRIYLNKLESGFAKHYAEKHGMTVSELMKKALFDEIGDFYLKSEENARDLLKALGYIKGDKV